MRFLRWDRALKLCMDKTGKGKDNRWDGDPMILNQEAHELPPEKQREALDFAEEAPEELRSKLAPIWKYCFVQWHIYDAGLEAIDRDRPLHMLFQDEDLLADVDSLQALADSGDLDQAATAENWTWHLLDQLAEAGSLRPCTDEIVGNLLKEGKEERHEGVIAFQEHRYDKAFWHSWQGLKLIAPAPASGVSIAKLRGDLLKNKAAAALKLGLKRTALGAANAALQLKPSDEKAWYRKSFALEALGREKEAVEAIEKAGLTPPPKTAAKRQATRQTGRPDKENQARELDPTLQSAFEKLVFVEIGVDSILAVDLSRHLQAELPKTPVSVALVYDFPSVEEAVSELMSRLNGKEGDFLRRKMASTVWRATCAVLGKDPLKSRGVQSSRKLFTEDEAITILSDLQRAYEEPGFVQSSKDIARQSAFEQRAFLVNLRPKALAAQRPVLEAHGYRGDAQGMRELECSIVNVAKTSDRVKEKLKLVRMAMQGGENGMWAINIERDGQWSDTRGMELRAQLTKSDPFGRSRINTNSVLA